ncbi:MAG: Glucan endo,3-beta-D-glucosidase [Pedosphaera sp.]|nr:Glucan endo,3-beta-D-glucosidase [Pedosphaera sp.]
MKNNKLSSLVIVLFFLTLGLPSVKAFSPDTWTPGPGWTLKWSDEFVGPAIDTNKWVWDLGGGGWGNNELEHYTQTNSYIANGELVIAATKDSTTYHSARIKTKGLYSQQFGKIAARIRLPYGKGMWPGWWMLGTNIDQVSWPQCGEIDIMEMVGGGLGFDDTIYSTLHWYDNGHQSQGSGAYAPLAAGQFFYQDYHVFETEWNSQKIIFRMDSVQYASIPIDSVNYPNRAAFQKPFYFLLNLAVGGTWPGNPDASTVFPQYMYVSWVRMYQPTPGLPATPTGLTANAVSSSQINLAWTASSGATSYNVKRATVSGGPYSTVAPGVTSTSYSDTGLTASQTYFYVVSAVNANGETPNSSEANATTTGGTAVLLSQAKPVTASSSQSGNGAANGNDGSLATRWSANVSTFPDWWRVDLGASHTLTKATINWYSSNSRAYKYKIEVSSNDVNYTTVVDRTGNTTNGDTTDTFSATGRYVRVTVTGSSAGWASFYECGIYGN